MRQRLWHGHYTRCGRSIYSIDSIAENTKGAVKIKPEPSRVDGRGQFERRISTRIPNAQIGGLDKEINKMELSGQQKPLNKKLGKQ